MNENQIVESIINNAGGVENIKKATHCVTRLRLYVRDDKKIDMKAIEKETGYSVVKSAGQYQIIIGPGDIESVYSLFVKEAKIEELPIVDENEEKQSLLNRFIAMLASIFQPSLSILAGAGIIKASVALLSAMGLVDSAGQTYVVLDALGDTFFMFFPIFIGMYAMKTFGGSPLLGAAIGAILVNPNITAWGLADNLYTMFPGTIIESGVKAEFMGLPIMLTRYGYYYSVIPTIFVSFIGAKVELLSKKIYPKTVHMFMVSATVMVVSALIGLLVVGPVISIASGLVTNLFLTIKAVAPVVYGGVLGGFWQLIVLFGLHWAIVPFSFIEFAEMQAGNVDKMTFIAAQSQVCFATIGAVLAVMIRDKDSETTKMGIPAFIVGFLGITEPALYGITLPKKTPFIMSCIAGAISGGFIALTNAGTYMIGGSGVLGLPASLNPAITNFLEQTDFFNMLIGSIMAFVIALALTLITYRKKEVVEAEAEESIVKSPVNGNVVNISEVNDSVFASGEMGTGIAIVPAENTLYAPVSGTVKSVFPTKHAIGFETVHGEEYLLHVGINTVELQGKYFAIDIKEGDKVKVGQKIGSADFNKISDAGYDSTVILINLNKNATIIECTNVSSNTQIMKMGV